MDKIVKRVIYVTRDIERALGTEPRADYHVIANRTPYAEEIKKQYPDFVTLVDSPAGPSLDTADLLNDHSVKSLITNSGPETGLLVFKTNRQIEDIAKNNGWILLNPSAALAEKVENKISQVEWLGELADKYLPPHMVVETKDVKWNKQPLVLQWAHSHTGLGTMLINSAEELKAIEMKFPNRPTRATVFAQGPSFTVNAVVSAGKVKVGNISYQITGLPPFTDNIFTTIGNDWALPHSLLSDTEIKYIEDMVKEIGARLAAQGWKGLYGVDVIRDDERDRIFLIEVNARQPASTTLESFLQKSFRENGVGGSTVFEEHLKALLGESSDSESVIVNDGAQIVQRVTKTVKEIPDESIGSLKLSGYMVIGYPNTEENSDLLRVQSMRGIMETHGRFNKRGEEIRDLISK